MILITIQWSRPLSLCHSQFPGCIASIFGENFVYIGRQRRNFVPYLCQLVLAAILWVKLLEMFVTLLSLISFSVD